MHQKVAFKSKSYNFKSSLTEDIISGKNKQTFIIETKLKPISSHMLPLWLSMKVCAENQQLPKRLSTPVLKSKNIKIYDFDVFDENQNFYRVDRVYPTDKQRISQIWLDKNMQCLPTKTKHKEADEPVIETILKSLEITQSTDI